MSTFKKEHIVAGLKSTTALEAIDEMIDHLVSVGAIPPKVKEPIATAVKKREQSMSTGIGSGVAIPHAATPVIGEVIMAFGRASQGIDFNSPDQQPVRLVMLVIVPTNEREKHLPTLARIARAFHRKEIRAALEDAANVDAIAGIFDASLNA